MTMATRATMAPFRTRMLGTESGSRRWVLGPISRLVARRNAVAHMFFALVAMALALDAPGEPAPKYGPDRFRLLPPYAEPGFVKGPVPPPDKNYWVALGEVVLIDTSIWAFNYIRGKEFAKISWDSIEQNFDKGWIIDTDDFWANGLGHPLHGNLTFNAARTLGLNFYESFAYSFFGSFLWEQ